MLQHFHLPKNIYKNLMQIDINFATIKGKAHLCLQQEDVRISHHALYAALLGSLCPPLHILDLVS